RGLDALHESVALVDVEDQDPVAAVLQVVADARHGHVEKVVLRPGRSFREIARRRERPHQGQGEEDSHHFVPFLCQAPWINGFHSPPLFIWTSQSWVSFPPLGRKQKPERWPERMGSAPTSLQG